MAIRKSQDTVKTSPFGRQSRTSILSRHFEQRPVSADRAWEFIYRELLWIDGSTGLAHLYESDKAQPGRSVWYDRTVLFTKLICKEFGDTPVEKLKGEIDGLFKECLERLIASTPSNESVSEIALAMVDEGAVQLSESMVQEAARLSARVPGVVADADFVTETAKILASRLGTESNLAEDVAREIVGKARYYFNVGRKRQNVLGEGFEDLIELLVAKLTTVPADRLKLRRKVDELPGFSNAVGRDRVESPDLAIVVDGQTKMLANVKWSLRQDRQKQLGDELDCYADLQVQKDFPRYVLITNEYDPGRLINSNALTRRGASVSCIYHVNTEFLSAVLSDQSKFRDDLQPLVQAGRLRSVSDFLKDLNRNFGTGEHKRPLTADQRRLKKKGGGK